MRVNASGSRESVLGRQLDRPLGCGIGVGDHKNVPHPCTTRSLDDGCMIVVEASVSQVTVGIDQHRVPDPGLGHDRGAGRVYRLGTSDVFTRPPSLDR